MFTLKLAASLMGLLAAMSTLSLGGESRPSPSSDPASRADSVAAHVFTELGAQSVAAAPADADPQYHRSGVPARDDTPPSDEDLPAGEDAEPDDEALPVGENITGPGVGTSAGADSDPAVRGARAGVETVPKDDGLSGAEPLDHVATAATDAAAIAEAESTLAVGTVSLLPVADAYVRAGGDAGRNFGATDSLKAMKASQGSDNPPTQSYLRFDVGAVGTITKATLRVFCNNDSRNSFDVLVTSVNWDEKTLTWNNKPAANGATVASVGATAKNKWVEVDVTSAVRTSTSVSIALLPRSTDAFAANSREEGANQPVLVLETSPAPPNATGSTSITAEADTFVQASKPTANFGSQPKVTMDLAAEGAGDVAYGFVRFRIGDVGPNIAKATLRIHVVGASVDSVDVHYISSNDWGETTTNWNNMPVIDGPQLSVIGNASSGSWLEVDVSSVVAPNSLLSLALVPRSDDNFDFTSREGNNKPQLILTTVADDAINLDCTIIVPDQPLSAAGLATPYELVATDPAAGACHEYTVDQRGFVEAAILDPATGQVTIYHPLVIDKGTVPVVPPVVPTLPPNAVVAIWIGYNGDILRQRGADATALANGRCVGGLLNGDAMGQFSHCNAVAFFEAANRAIAAGQLVVPPLGVASDGQLCPNVRDFFTVDQDQSDNVLTTYLLTGDNRLAQNTAANRTRLGPGAKVIVNPSDNRVTAVLLDQALGCTPWNVPSLDNPGELVPSLVLNELLAAKWQPDPVATVPLLDPFAVLEDGTPSLAKLNLHRVGVGQAPIATMAEAISHQLDYCRNFRAIQPARLFLNRSVLSARPSPFPDIGNSAFGFLVTRFNVSWEILTCTEQIGLDSPISLIQNADGVTIDATLGP